LGGLVQDQLDNVVEKVPVLGDLPLLGHLFRYETRRMQKTNLMLFLRPHVVREEAGSRFLTSDRYDFMRKLEQQTQPAPHFALPAMEGPILEELHMGQKPRSSSPSAPAQTPDR
jgi:general secretion pathway protein D